MTRNGQYNLPEFIPLETGRPSRPSGVFDALSLTGFTLVEVVIVLMIMAILAAIAVPLYNSTASIQLKTAANIVASDLEYAKSMAMSTGRNYSVVFNDSNESYRIKDANGQVIPHPVHIGARDGYTVSFANDSRVDKVDMSANFDSKNGVRFDYLGVPYAWDGSSVSSLNNGSVLLSAEGDTLTVRVEPVTGYISIE